MDKKGIIEYCKELGCCDACCLRYIGVKNPKYYGNSSNVVNRYQHLKTSTDISFNEDFPSKDGTPKDIASNSNKDKDCIEQDSVVNVENGHNSDNNGNISEENSQISINTENNTVVLTDSQLVTNKINNTINVDGSSNDNVTPLEATKENSIDQIDSPPAKRTKLNVCPSCLGVLQENLWVENFEMVKEMLEKKGYECGTYGCALSSPIAILLREKAIILRICDKFPSYDGRNVTAIKESWKWSFATKMAGHINKTLDSGAVSPLLITLNYDYPDDLQELEILKSVSPKLFESRNQQKRRFNTEFTRRSVEQALEDATLESLIAAGGGLPVATAPAKCVSVVCNHNPIYLGGRYLKLSRNLPQSPWVLDGRRVLPSSVQEIIFKPISELYKLSAEDAEQKLKFVAAGREDVDVRCLGDGRPFAIEITDPRRQLNPDELAKACEEISGSGDVVVKSMLPITRDDLTQLKKGEETKNKTYEALCIKLTHSKYDDVPPESPITVTDDDIRRINEYRNTDEGDPWKIKISQKTPIRVLHRRPLLTRTRGIIALTAYNVPEHPQLFRLVMQTTAGTYVKEWVCGELGRTNPGLETPVGAKTDLVALDVSAVHLQWPPVTDSLDFQLCEDTDGSLPSEKVFKLLEPWWRRCWWQCLSQEPLYLLKGN